jgi:hypothetical protein
MTLKTKQDDLRLKLERYPVRILAGDISYPDWGLSSFPLVNQNNCRVSISIKPLLLPSKSFRIHLPSYYPTLYSRDTDTASSDKPPK